MRVALSKFACDGIEAQLGAGAPTGVRMALFHYAGKLATGRRTTPFPSFLTDRGPAEPATTFDLIVDPETEALLKEEAAKQGVEMERLVSHAVLVYLAELEFLRAAPHEQRRSAPSRPPTARPQP